MNTPPKIASDYVSFLICFRNEAEVYRNGLPIGVVRNGVFEPHQHKLPDGSKRPVEVDVDLADRVAAVAAAMTLFPHTEAI
jgi:hypothetical protein